MGREEEYPLSIAQAINMASLLASVNFLRAVYGKPLKVNSGYRPGKYNKAAGGAAKSPHLMCQAIDLDDNKEGALAAWCLSNLELLANIGLYMEDPAYTEGWVHLQILRPVSGNRVFVPYSKVMAGTTPRAGGLS